MTLQVRRSQDGQSFEVFDVATGAVVDPSTPEARRFAGMTHSELVTLAAHGEFVTMAPAQRLRSPSRSTTSSIVHAPTTTQRAPAPAPKEHPLMPALTDDQLCASFVANMNATERQICLSTGVAPLDWARQRLHELRTGRTNGLDTSRLPLPVAGK